MQITANRIHKTIFGGKRNMKFKLGCSDLITDEHPDTRDWLTIESKFDHASSEYKIYKGLLNKDKRAVVKVGNNISSLQKEYDFSKTLFDLSIPNFIKYYCLLKCSGSDDNLHNPAYICKGPGDSLGALIMTEYAYGQIDKHEWKKLEQVKAVMKQVCCAIILAYTTCRFVHKDLHLGNVLIKRTNKIRVGYANYMQIETHGYYAIIMDFDRSTFAEPGQVDILYRDLFRFLNLCNSELNLKINLSKPIEFARQLKDIAPPLKSPGHLMKILCNLIERS